MKEYQDILNAIILAETGGDPNGGYTNDPTDAGGRTIWGISERANRDLWKDGPPTREQAERRYYERYIHPFRLVKDRHLLHQLVDWGVTSGPATAARVLQQLVGVKTDGAIGPQTVAAIERYPGGKLFGTVVSGAVLLNLRLRDARALFYVGITKRNPTQLRFILGWLNRTFEFS